MTTINKRTDPLKKTLNTFRRDLTTDLAEQTKNIINESLADFRMSLNKDLDQRFEKFADDYSLAEMVKKGDLKEALSNHPTHKDLTSAVLDITDAIDTTMADHLVKHHAIKVLH